MHHYLKEYTNISRGREKKYVGDKDYYSGTRNSRLEKATDLHMV